MQYTSPLSLLITTDPKQIDKKSISLAKKKMLSEFELSGGNTVMVNGREMTKNDVIRFFDSLQQANDMSYHFLIADDPILLIFLEKNEVIVGDSFKKNNTYNDLDFIEWISPYFYTSFTNAGFASISTLNERVWAAMFGNPLLMNNYYQQQAWDFFEKELLIDLDRLSLAVRHTEPVDEHLLSALCDLNYVKIMKKLPEERFGSFRDQYAFAIMNASVHVFNKGMRGTAEIYMDNAMLLAASADTKDIIAKKQAQMDVIARHSSPESRREGNNWMSIRIVLFVLVVILKLATCNSWSHSTTNLNDIPVFVNGQAYDSAQRIDSFIKKVQQTRIGDTISIHTTNTDSTGGIGGLTNKAVK